MKTRSRSTTQRKRRERVFDGLAISPGIAIGPAHVSAGRRAEVPEYRIAAGEVAAERQRFAEAVVKSSRQLTKLKAKSAVLPAAAVEEIGYLLDAHLHMIQDSRLVHGVEARIVNDRINAEAAVHGEIFEITKGFSEIEDRYLAARAVDITDVGERLIRNLTKTPYQAYSVLPQGSVIIAEDLSPADTALMDPRRIGGFATVLGGAEGHTAVMARSLGIPAVLGVAGLTADIRSGDVVVVDGSAGRIVVNPSESSLAFYVERRETLDLERRQLTRLRNLPAVTLNGVDIQMHANIEMPRELDGALEAGATGIGLLRTEFLFMNRDDLPGEDEQYRALLGIVSGMGGRPVTIRTLDLGGEKLAAPLGSRTSQSLNPALGLRAIRIALNEPQLMETQLAAMLRAGAHGPIRILLPMVTMVEEVRQVREILRKVARRLKRRHVAIADPLPPVGAMIEIPGAALTADALAGVCDFFAIGTNDLTMYTLAIDRADESVAYLYNPLHPAVLRLIQFATEAALRARIPVSLCGEMAGDPRYASLLLGLGIRDLSMNPASLLRVKQRIRAIDLVAATQRARLIMEQWDAGQITVLLDDFNALA
ncbi:MAG: phosphoenolpyruvate--protein phosphotransferase [Alphaproteobacteria bacterium]